MFMWWYIFSNYFTPSTAFFITSIFNPISAWAFISAVTKSGKTQIAAKLYIYNAHLRAELMVQVPCIKRKHVNSKVIYMSGWPNSLRQSIASTLSHSLMIIQGVALFILSNISLRCWTSLKNLKLSQQMSVEKELELCILRMEENTYQMNVRNIWS